MSLKFNRSYGLISDKCLCSSNVSSTQSRALQHIAALAVEDPFLQSLFVVLGAENVLKTVQKDVHRYIVRDEGLLLSRSSKALACLSRNEVNTIVQKSLRSDEISTTEMLQALSKYIGYAFGSLFPSHSRSFIPTQRPSDILPCFTTPPAHNFTHECNCLPFRSLLRPYGSTCIAHVRIAASPRMGLH